MAKPQPATVSPALIDKANALGFSIDSTTLANMRDEDIKHFLSFVAATLQDHETRLTALEAKK